MGLLTRKPWTAGYCEACGKPLVRRPDRDKKARIYGYDATTGAPKSFGPTECWACPDQDFVSRSMVGLGQHRWVDHVIS